MFFFQDSKIVVYINESKSLRINFLERLNSLMANYEVKSFLKNDLKKIYDQYKDKSNKFFEIMA